MESGHVPTGQQPTASPEKTKKQLKYEHTRRVKLAAKRFEILKEIKADSVPTDRANTVLVQKYIVSRIREFEITRRWPETRDREIKKMIAETTYRSQAMEIIAKEKGVILPDVSDKGFIIRPTNETATKFELNY